MSKGIIITIFILFFIFSSATIAKAEYCQWTTVQPGLYCSTELGNISWQEKDKTNCFNKKADTKNQRCCCISELPREKESVKPKYIIIAILTVIFASITGYVIFIRK